jgi:hypothetical protein
MAITEPSAGSDPGAIQATARRESDRCVLNGTKIVCIGGPAETLPDRPCALRAGSPRTVSRRRAARLHRYSIRRVIAVPPHSAAVIGPLVELLAPLNAAIAAADAGAPQQQGPVTNPCTLPICVMTQLDTSRYSGQDHAMATTVKFSSKIDARVLKGLRAHAAREGRTLSAVLTAAAEQYLQRAAIRPVFRTAVREVLDEHAVLLERLAR